MYNTTNNRKTEKKIPRKNVREPSSSIVLRGIAEKNYIVFRKGRALKTLPGFMRQSGLF